MSFLRNLLLVLGLGALSFVFGFFVLSRAVSPSGVQSRSDTGGKENASASPPPVAASVSAAPVRPQSSPSASADGAGRADSASVPTLEPAPREENIQKPEPIDESRTPSESSAPIRPGESGAQPNSSTQSPQDTQSPSNPDTGTASSNSDKTDAPPAVSERLYRVQIGVFTTREAADQEVSRAIEKGFAAAVVPVEQSGRTLYRVQHAVFKVRSNAEAARRKLTDAGLEATIINPE